MENDVVIAVDDEFAGKSLGQIAEFMAATATLIEVCAANVARHQARCQKDREFLVEMTELYERLARYIPGKASAATVVCTKQMEEQCND